MKRIAGIDYGKARIGVALSDERQIIASPLICLAASKKMEATAQLILTTLAPYQPLDAIILGLPLLFSGKPGEMAELVQKLAELLKEAQPAPLILWDERLTSAQVERTLREANLNRKQRSKLIDALAAAAILQNYLDTEKREK
jgi:putative Holliday junction resolvase